MRLRRESGNYEFVLATSGAASGTCKLKTNEELEEFVGAVINNAGVLEVVTAASESSGVYTLTAGSHSYTYTKSTGVLAVVTEQAAGGGGGGTGM